MGVVHLTRLVLKKYKGELVFTLGSLRFDGLSTTYCGEACFYRRLSVIRNGTEIDQGEIVELGGHNNGDTSFFGFQKIVPKKSGPYAECHDPLESAWFSEGDIFELPVHHSTFRARLVGWWMSEEQYNPKYAKLKKKCDEVFEQEAIEGEKAFQKRNGFDSQEIIDRKREWPPGEYDRLIRRMRNSKAYDPLHKRIRVARLPAVIRYKP